MLTTTADGRRATSTSPRSSWSGTTNEPPPSRATRGAVGGAGVQVEPDQPGDVLGGGAPGDLGRRALLHDPAVLEHEQPVGEHERLERVVGDEQARPGEVGEVPLELGLHVEAGARVEGRERLVEQQQRRVARQRPGQRDPLRLPPGQVGGPAARQIGQPEPGQPVGGDGRAAGARPSPRARGENATLSSTLRCGKSR